MVSREQIEYLIDKSITVIKCPATSKAKHRVEDAIVTYCDQGAMFKSYDRLEYPDGTVIQFHNKADAHNVDLDYITLDGKTYNYLYSDSYNTFKKQEKLLDKNTYESDFFSTDNPLSHANLMNFANHFATFEGLTLNEALRKDIPVDELIISDTVKANLDKVIDFENTNTVDDTDYVSYRVTGRLHDNDSVNKKIVSDKAFTSTSVGAEKDLLKTVFVHNTGLDLDDGSYWQILTVVDKDSGVTGAFLGNALTHKRGEDAEMEIQFAPRQKFERVLIDEEHKIIIQKPVVKK